MKKTQRIDLITTIRRSIVSFFAITMFVALGVGLFLGIHWIAGSMHSMADNAFAAGKAHHIEITFPYGLTEDDLAQLGKVEGVDEIEGGYLSYQELAHNNKKLVARMGQLPEKIDTFLEVEGTLPSKANEMAISSISAKNQELKIGDTVKLLSDLTSDDDEKSEGTEKEKDPDGMRYLNGGEYTITAIVNSPAFLARNPATWGVATVGSGTIDLVAWVTEDAFDASAFRDGKPYVVLRSNALDGLAYSSKEYTEGSEALEKRVKALGNQLGDKRFQDLYSAGKAKIDEGQATLDEKTSELEEGKKKAEEGEKQIAEGEKKLEEGKKELEEGKASYTRLVEEAERQLADALAKLTSGREQYNNAAAELDSWRNKLADAENQYNQAISAVAGLQSQLDYYLNTYNDLMNALTEGWITREEFEFRVNELGAAIEGVLAEYGIYLDYRLSTETIDGFFASSQSYIDQVRNRPFTVAGITVTLNTAPAELEKARNTLYSAEQTLDEKYQELTAGEAQYNSAKAEYEQKKAEAEQKIAEGEKQVAEGSAELADRKKQLEEGKKVLAEGEQKLADAEAQLEEGRAALAALVDYSWIVLPRSYNGSVIFMDSLAQVTANLRWSMASLFLIVGILVCYSAVSRLVHEQLVRIGTKKAVGFRRGEINSLFISYAALCVVFGAILGYLIAMLVVQPILLHSLNPRFVAESRPFFSPVDALLITALEFVLIIGSTWFAVTGVLKMTAVELLAGEKPPSAKKRFYENWGIWKRASLLVQTTVNNCVNDTRRVVGTLVGVAGCTALIVCAVMLDDNVARSFTRQYDAINHYDIVVSVTPLSEAAEKGEKELEGAGMNAAMVYRQSLSLEQPDGTRSSVTVTVPMSSKEYEDFFSIIPLPGSDLSNEGVWISEAYAEHLGAKVGDEVIVADTTGKQHSWKIAGFFEYHLTTHQMVVSLDQYEEAFGIRPAANKIVVDSKGKGSEAVTKIMRGFDGFVSSYDDKAGAKSGFDEFSSVASIVVVIYLVLAAVMAACVLLNLDFMFVDEKKRELIVLMINGYSLKDAKGYIWHDSVVLTALGIILGLFLGNTVGGFTVRSIEQSASSFLHDVSLLAVGAGVLGSVALAAAALIIALRRIDKFALTDINRY